jgi:hypothetical protein
LVGAVVTVGATWVCWLQAPSTIAETIMITNKLFAFLNISFLLVFIYYQDTR